MAAHTEVPAAGPLAVAAVAVTAVPGSAARQVLILCPLPKVMLCPPKLDRPDKDEVRGEAEPQEANVTCSISEAGLGIYPELFHWLPLPAPPDSPVRPWCTRAVMFLLSFFLCCQVLIKAVEIFSLCLNFLSGLLHICLNTSVSDANVMQTPLYLHLKLQRKTLLIFISLICTFLKSRLIFLVSFIPSQSLVSSLVSELG